MAGVIKPSFKYTGVLNESARHDGVRDVAERFIRDAYAAEYGAELDPSRILALLNERGEIVCAAGVRLANDGFFSELCLDSPIEQALGASTRPIPRDEIFEVTTFASRAPRATMGFIQSVGSFGMTNGFVWSFFTLTRRLHRLVERLGHPLTHLADADYRRIPDHRRWGTYYASEPKVFAAASPRLAFARQVTGSLRPFVRFCRSFVRRGNLAQAARSPG
jgi:hypothetical protein